MDLLNLLGGRVEGDRKPISPSLLKDYDVAVLVDNSTRMLKQGRWDEVPPELLSGVTSAQVF